MDHTTLAITGFVNLCEDLLRPLVTKRFGKLPTLHGWDKEDLLQEVLMDLVNRVRQGKLTYVEPDQIRMEVGRALERYRGSAFSSE